MALEKITVHQAQKGRANENASLKMSTLHTLFLPVASEINTASRDPSLALHSTQSWFHGHATCVAVKSSMLALSLSSKSPSVLNKVPCIFILHRTLQII